MFMIRIVKSRDNNKTNKIAGKNTDSSGANPIAGSGPVVGVLKTFVNFMKKKLKKTTPNKQHCELKTKKCNNVLGINLLTFNLHFIWRSDSE